VPTGSIPCRASRDIDRLTQAPAECSATVNVTTLDC
jgi:hypothetical protein